MNNELKQKIDAIWLYSDFGKWCKAIASNDSKTADSLCKQIFDSGYPEMEILEDELANNIAKLMKSESDIDEYLQLVEKENSDLVSVLIKVELFYMVPKYIMKNNRIRRKNFIQKYESTVKQQRDQRYHSNIKRNGVIDMMLQPTEEALELQKKVDEAKTEEERKKAEEKLKAYWINFFEKNKNFPFV